MKTAKKRVIVDLDAGTDDAHALVILLYAEKIGNIIIEAICCTMGNTTCENVSKNVVRILETAKRTDIPVYKGCSGPLLPIEQPFSKFHGEDGFGDVVYEKEPNIDIIRKVPSVIAMADIVSKNAGEISLVCLGPLTNVAIAIRLFDNFIKDVKDIYLMGGNYTAVGNITPSAEYNFYVDPEAAYILLESVTCPVYICTWESCLETHIPFKWRWNTLGVVDSPLIKLLNNAERTVYKNMSDDSFWLPCDAFLAAALIHPEKITKRQSKHRATVELNGSKTRAQIVLDHLKEKEPNVTVIEKIDYDFFKDFIYKVYTELKIN